MPSFMEMSTTAVTMVRHSVTLNYTRSGGAGASSLAIALALIFICVLCCKVSALEVGELKSSSGSMNTKARYASAKAVQDFQRAIDGPDLQLKVEAALAHTSDGLNVCHSGLYRCNSVTGVIEEAVINGMRSGTVKWNEFPESVKRIRITNSRLSQPLVLSSLPANLEEFLATNVEWQFNSILRNWPSGEKPLGDGGIARLRVFQCDGCALVKAEFTPEMPPLASLRALSLSGNPELLVDIRKLPRALESLHVSHTKLVHSTVKEVLEAVPVSLSRLNISFTGINLTLDMLSSASKQLVVLDVSGLGGGNPGSLLPASQLQRACSESGFNPRELFLRRCGVTGFLPDLRKCTKLRVLDLSHNFLQDAALAQLPETMELLNLSDNAIRSSLRTGELPRLLRFLDLSKNLFMGPFDISELPQQMRYLDISHNSFNGALNLTKLPESAKFVYIQHNRFTGTVDLVDIPLGIRFIMVHHNNWDYRLPAL